MEQFLAKVKEATGKKNGVLGDEIEERIKTHHSAEEAAQIETHVQTFLELIGGGARKGERHG